MDAVTWLDSLDEITRWARSGGQAPAPAQITEQEWTTAAQELTGHNATDAQAAHTALAWWGRREVVDGYLTRVRDLGVEPVDAAGHDLRMIDVFNGPRTVATFRTPAQGPGGLQLLGVDLRAGARQEPTCALLVRSAVTGTCRLGPDFMSARATSAQLAGAVRATGGGADDVAEAKVWLLQQWVRIQSLETVMAERDQAAEFVRRARIRLDNAERAEDLPTIQKAARLLEMSLLPLVEIESALAWFDDDPSADLAR